MTRILHLFVTSVAISYCGLANAQTTPNARVILRKMVARYKTASFYQDSGTVTLLQSDPKTANRLEEISFQRPPFDGDTLVTFTTYFARPGMFRFDWKSTMLGWSRKASIWSDGKKIYTWMPSPGSRDSRFILSTSRYLFLSIDEAQPSSAAAVFPLTSMFIKKASVVSFSDLLDMGTELSLIKEEPIEREMCYVIKINLSGAPWTLWIDKQRHILRKTRTVYSYGSFDERVEQGVRHELIAEETRRDIRINEPISKNVFRYRPTLQAGDFDLTR